MARIVGIGLGTTNSLVAYMDKGTPRVISARHERAMVPSVVALTDNGLIVGDPAKEHLTRNPERTVYSVKRFMGKSLADVQGELAYFPPAQIAGQRSQTVVPTQSLFLMNNELLRKRAQALASQLLAEPASVDEGLSRLWLRVFNRPVTSAEREDAAAFLAELDGTLDAEDAAARQALGWQELCHSLLASNEFVYRL